LPAQFLSQSPHAWRICCRTPGTSCRFFAEDKQAVQVSGKKMCTTNISHTAFQKVLNVFHMFCFNSRGCRCEPPSEFHSDLGVWDRAA
jgi:hypothetical protein